MYEIVGTDSTLADAASYNFEKSFNPSSEKQVKVETVNGAENKNDFDSLLDKLVNMCQQPISMTAAESSLRSNSYFGALQSVFQTYKDTITLPFTSHELAKLQEQSRALDKSLTDCIANINETEKNEDDLSSLQIEDSITNAHENLPKNVEFLSKEINKRHKEMKNVLGRQCRIRPISNIDLDNVDQCFQVQKLHWTNQIKNNICNASLVATSYFIKRQRRRNFPKKATRILNEYFESHMKHPYPDEPTKLRLAQACGVSVAQVSPGCLALNDMIFMSPTGSEINGFASRRRWIAKVQEQNCVNVTVLKVICWHVKLYLKSEVNLFNKLRIIITLFLACRSS